MSMCILKTLVYAFEHTYYHSFKWQENYMIETNAFNFFSGINWHKQYIIFKFEENLFRNVRMRVQNFFTLMWTFCRNTRKIWEMPSGLIPREKPLPTPPSGRVRNVIESSLRREPNKSRDKKSPSVKFSGFLRGRMSG